MRKTNRDGEGNGSRRETWQRSWLSLSRLPNWPEIPSSQQQALILSWVHTFLHKCVPALKANSQGRADYPLPIPQASNTPYSRQEPNSCSLKMGPGSTHKDAEETQSCSKVEANRDSFLTAGKPASFWGENEALVWS